MPLKTASQANLPRMHGGLLCTPRARVPGRKVQLAKEQELLTGGQGKAST